MKNQLNSKTRRRPKILDFTNEKNKTKSDKKNFSFINIFFFYLMIYVVCITNYSLCIKITKKFSNSEELITNIYESNKTDNTLNLAEESNLIYKDNNLKKTIKKSLDCLQIFLRINLVFMLIILFIKFFVIYIFSIFSNKIRKKKEFLRNKNTQVNLDKNSLSSQANDLTYLNDKRNNILNLYKNLKILKIYFLKFVLFMLAIQSIFQFILLKYFTISVFSEINLINVFPYFHCIIIFIFIYYVSVNYLMNFFGFLLGNILVLIMINNDLIKIIFTQQTNILDIDLRCESCILFSGLIIISVLNYKIIFNNRANHNVYQNIKLDFIQTKDTLEHINSAYISFGENVKISYNKKFCQIFTILKNKLIKNGEKHNFIFSLLNSLKFEDHSNFELADKCKNNKFVENDEQLNESKYNSATNIFHKTVYKKKSNFKSAFQFIKNAFSPEKSKITEDSCKNNLKSLKFQDNCLNINKKSHIELDQADTEFFMLLMLFDKHSIQLDPQLNFELKEFTEEFLLLDFEEDNFSNEINKLQIINNPIQIQKIQNNNYNIENLKDLNSNSSDNIKNNIINENSLKKDSNQVVDFQKEKVESSLLNYKHKYSEENKIDKSDFNSNKNSNIENFTNNHIIFVNNRDSKENSFQNNNLNEEINFKNINEKSKLNVNDQYLNSRINQNISDVKIDESISINFNNSSSDFINLKKYANNDFSLENKFKQEIEIKSIQNTNENNIHKFKINNLRASVKDVKSNFINSYYEDLNTMMKANSKYSDCNSNSKFSSYFEKKKIHFKKLINIISTKYSQTNDFFRFFTFDKNLDQNDFNDNIYIEVFIRLNKFSNRIEFLVNDVSHIFNIVKSTSEKEIKTKFLNKFSHEFRNPILNIIQLIKNLKLKISENKTNAREIISRKSNNNLNRKDFIYFNNNNKSKSSIYKQKSSLNNSDVSESTKIITNVEFTSFSIHKELLEKENFFKRNILLSDRNSLKEYKSNSEFSNKGADIINSYRDLDKKYLENLKELSINSNNENLNNHIPKTDRNKRNPSNNLSINDKEYDEDILPYNKDKKHLKSSRLSSLSFSQNLNSNKSSNFEFIDNKSNSSCDIQNRKFSFPESILNNQDSLLQKKQKYDNLKLNKSKLQNLENSNNLTMNNINTLEENLENLENLNNEIIHDLNTIKYICYNLNLQINDFDFITNLETNFEKNFITNHCEPNSLQIFDENYQNNMPLLTTKTFAIRFDIRKLLKKIVKMFKSIILLSGKKLTFNLEIDENIPYKIKSSSQKITQILFNLLSNSIKFTKVGFINLKVKYEYNNSKLLFNISDTGIGIKKEFIKAIFKPYTKIKDDLNNIYGLGLGLYVVKLNIESLNGQIQVESKENEFTDVSFYIITENSNTTLNENSIKSNEINYNSTILFKAPSIKSSENSIDNNIFKSKTSNNFSYEETNRGDKVITSITNKLFDSSEAEDSSVLGKDSYEENLLPNINCLGPYDRYKYLSKANSIYKIIKKKNIEDHKLNKGGQPKSSKTQIYNKHVFNYENSLFEIPNLNIIRSKSYEISFEQISISFRKAFNFASNLYYQISKRNNKSSPNNIQDNYRLCINQEDTKINFLTTIYSKDNNSNKKRSKDLKGLADNSRIRRVLSKFSNKSNLSNFNKKHSFNKNEGNTILLENLDKIIDSPLKKEINSDSSFDEINFNKILESNINPSPFKAPSNDTIDLNSIIRNKSILENENLNKNNNQQTNLLKVKSYDATTELQKTINYDNEFNFNYKTLKSADPTNSPIYVIKSLESDMISNYTNLSNPNLNNINDNLNNPMQFGQTVLSINNNLETNQTKSVTNPENSNRSKVYLAVKKKKSDLMLSKIKENTKIIPNLTSIRSYTKNNISQNFYKKYTDKVRILIVDDEKLIRQSNINLIRKFFKNKNTNFQVYECEDGFDCLNYIYQAKLVGINFDYIITDQTMNFITGTLLSDIIRLLVENKVINDIKIFLLTSYSTNLFEKQSHRFSNVFSKPFKIEHLDLIFNGFMIKD